MYVTSLIGLTKVSQRADANPAYSTKWRSACCQPSRPGTRRPVFCQTCLRLSPSVQTRPRSILRSKGKAPILKPRDEVSGLLSDAYSALGDPPTVFTRTTQLTFDMLFYPFLVCHVYSFSFRTVAHLTHSIPASEGTYIPHHILYTASHPVYRITSYIPHHVRYAFVVIYQLSSSMLALCLRTEIGKFHSIYGSIRLMYSILHRLVDEFGIGRCCGEGGG